MDARVLQAQQWVNATYRGVAGYQPVAEDGVTGYRTVYALVRGLQHELGVTTLSDTFGPTTLGLLTQRGGIRTSDTGNLVSLVQCALYCKGYDPGGITGTFGPGTQQAVGTVMTQAGLGPLGTAIAPKVVKTLFTLDAYTLAPGGRAAVRTVQQWLNGRYLSHANSFVVPCDGLFSRDVATALNRAVQYELGLTDDQATGTFGPATRSGLAGHVLSAGATGVFVQLFAAGMITNRVRVSGSVYASFPSTFDSALVAAVKAFQAFSQLPVTGKGDYATWCQLYVSTGDPDRAASACDSVTQVTTARAKALYAAGYRFVGRYLDDVPGSTLHKRLQAGELATIFHAGLKVFPISQYAGNDVTAFTYARGYADATAAHTRAAGYGFRPGTVVYFAVDADATAADISAHVLPYFHGVLKSLQDKGSYGAGVYGSRNVCAQVSTLAGVRWSFVSGMSTGFSGNLGYPLPDNWAFDQVQTRTVGTGTGSIEVDRDVHRSGTDPGTSSVLPVGGAA